MDNGEISFLRSTQNRQGKERYDHPVGLAMGFGMDPPCCLAGFVKRTGLAGVGLRV